MSEVNKTREQLYKAHYFYAESAGSLELAREDAQKVSGLCKKMTNLLMEMQLRRRAALESALGNAVHNEETKNQVGLALDVLDPIRAEIPTSEKLSQPLIRALESLEHVERILDYTVDVLANKAPYATRQMIDADANFRRATGQNGEAQQHFTDAAAACMEYTKSL